MTKLPIDFNNFSGGYCSHPIEDNEAAEMLDCMVRRDGVLVGTLPFQETGNDISGVFVAFHNSESGTFAMATNGIYKYDTTTSTWTLLQGITVTSSYLGSIAQFDNWIMFGHRDLTDLYVYNVDTGTIKAAIKRYDGLATEAEMQVLREEEMKQWWTNKYPTKPYPGYDAASRYYYESGAYQYGIFNGLMGDQRRVWKQRTASFAPDIVACDGNYAYATNDNFIYYTATPGFTKYYSIATEEMNDTTGWDTNVFLVPESDDRIIDMKVMYGRLYIFKKSGITVKSGGDEASFSLEKVSNEPCCSRVAVSPQGIYFLGPDCLMRFDGSKSVKVSAKIDPSVLTASLCEARVFYSSRTNTVYIPSSDGVLYCYDEIMDRWHRRSYPDVICMHEAFYEPSGKTNECSLEYTGNYRCKIRKAGNYLYSEVGGVADPAFTMPDVLSGGTDGTIDLTDASVNTVGTLRTFINSLGDYTFSIINAISSSASNTLSDTGWTGCTDKEFIFRGTGGAGGSFMRMSLLSSGKVYEEDTSESIGTDGVLVTKKLTFGSPELQKFPYRLYLYGSVGYFDTFREDNTQYIYRHSTPARINYYSPSGVPAYDMTLTFYNVGRIENIKFVADGINV